MNKEISVDFIWIDEECAEIWCPYCKEELMVGIYRDSIEPCKCGKKFVLHQRNWVEEVE